MGEDRRCPICGNPLIGECPEGYKGPLCGTQNGVSLFTGNRIIKCRAWRTTGMSRNGGPLLTLVDDDG